MCISNRLFPSHCKIYCFSRQCFLYILEILLEVDIKMVLLRNLILEFSLESCLLNRFAVQLLSFLISVFKHPIFELHYLGIKPVCMADKFSTADNKCEYNLHEQYCIKKWFWNLWFVLLD